MPSTQPPGRPGRSELLRAVLRANAGAEGLDIAALPVPVFLGHVGRWVRDGSVPLPSEHMVPDLMAAFAAPTAIDALRLLDWAARRRAAAGLTLVDDGPPPDEEAPPIEEEPPIEEDLPDFIEEIVDLRDKPLIFVPGILGRGSASGSSTTTASRSPPTRSIRPRSWTAASSPTRSRSSWRTW